MKNKILALSFLALTACASSGPVPLGKDSYMITKNGSGGIFGTPAQLKAELLREASTFCTSTNKIMQISASRETPAGAGTPFASAEVHFMCLAENDPEIARPKLLRNPDTVIEVKNTK